jgi:hypothetical protein
LTAAEPWARAFGAFLHGQDQRRESHEEVFAVSLVAEAQQLVEGCAATEDLFALGAQHDHQDLWILA